MKIKEGRDENHALSFIVSIFSIILGNAM